MLALFFVILILVCGGLILHRLGRLDVNSDGETNKEDISAAVEALRQKISRNPPADLVPEPVVEPEAKRTRKKKGTTHKKSIDDIGSPERPTEPLTDRPGNTGEVL